MFLSIEHHSNGPRLRVLGRRVHHWHCGLGLLAVGCAVVWRDRRDLVDVLLGIA